MRPTFSHLRVAVCLAAATLLTAAACPAAAQETQHHGSAASQATVLNAAPVDRGDSATRPAEGTLVDQVVAVVDGELILESDVSADRRFQAFRPFRQAGKPYSRDEAVEQLVDRTLILEQARLQPGSEISDVELAEQIAKLRKDIPACAEAHCETDEGWKRFVQDQGLTMGELDELVRQQTEVLKFIELRFRTGIRIAPEDIKAYYDNTLLPQYRRLNAPAPRLPVLSERIQEILLEQQVSSLLTDWLKSLKAQGAVRILRPGEVQP